MEHIFIINPSAGKGRAKKLIPAIEAALEGTEYGYSIYQTKAAGDAERFVRESCETGKPVRFYIGGGDGSFNEAVNGAKGFPHAEIGLIPLGTGNDFIRNFGKKQEFMDILSQVEGKSIPCDAIAVNGRYAVNMVNIGFDCEVVAKAAEWKKKPLVSGLGAYLMGIATMLAKPMGTPMAFRWGDGTTMTGKFLLCTIANGSFCGGGFCSSPQAALDDGRMDVGIVRMISRGKFIRLLPKYKAGTYLDTKVGQEKVVYEKCSNLELAVSQPTNLSMDGEISQFTYLKAEIVPRAFRFIVPKGLRE